MLAIILPSGMYRAPDCPMPEVPFWRMVDDLQDILDLGDWEPSVPYTFTYEGYEVMVNLDRQTQPMIYYDYTPAPGEIQPRFLGVFP